MDPILAHISNVLCLFYVNVVGRCFGEVTKNATDPSQHGTLKGAYVHEMTLCVTFLAPHVRTHFRIFIRCSKYTAILMLPRTHVPRMTVCVTFRARLRSVPLGLSNRLFGNLGRQGRPRLPKDPGMVPSSDHSGCRSRPRMPSRPYFGTPALTSKPPVGYQS